MAAWHAVEQALRRVPRQCRRQECRRCARWLLWDMPLLPDAAAIPRPRVEGAIDRLGLATRLRAAFFASLSHAGMDCGSIRRSMSTAEFLVDLLARLMRTG